MVRRSFPASKGAARIAHPDSISAHSNLGNIYASTGKQALVEYRAAIRLDPGRAPSYASLADTCLALNRMDEAEQPISEARKRRLNGEYLLQIRYWLAFLRDDSTEMQRVASEASQQSGTDALLLFLEANTQANGISVCGRFPHSLES